MAMAEPWATIMATPDPQVFAPSQRDIDRLSLVQWLSPSFPTGGFAYSHGLETAIAGGLREPAAIGDWVGDVVTRGGGWTDAVLLSLALKDEDIAELALIARALAGSMERLTETMDQGRAFGATIAAMTGHDVPALPLPLAVALAARGLDLPIHDITAHYLHAFAANLIQGATRFVPLGQSQGQRLLASLHPTIAETARRAVFASADDLGSACFGAELSAMEHETLDIRIFRT